MAETSELESLIFRTAEAMFPDEPKRVPGAEAIIQAVVEQATSEIQRELLAAYEQLEYLWTTTHHCPCGARSISLDTHSHVTGCATAKAVEALSESEAPHA